MFNSFLSKNLLTQVRRTRDPTTHFKILQNPYLRFIYKTSYTNDPSSFTVSYLINSCGLSPESALAVSKKIHLKDTSKPDSILNYFKNNGFTKAQISNLIIRRPLLLLANPNKTLDPKLQFLKKIGISSPNIAKILSSDPNFLTRSLKSLIIPSFNFLKSLLHTDENVAAAITSSSSSSWILIFNLQKTTTPKIQILRDIGVPESNIVKIIMLRPRILTRNNNRFLEMVNEIGEMGFNPSSMMFAYALHIVSGMSKASKEAKLGIYRGFGWSEDDICLAIRNQPMCIAISEKKIRDGLDFFMNKLNWEPSALVKYPNLLGFSLEKRIIPRWTIIEVLLSKGLITHKLNYSVLSLTDVKFFEKFVTKYENEAPELLKLHQGPR